MAEFRPSGSGALPFVVMSGHLARMARHLNLAGLLATALLTAGPSHAQNAEALTRALNSAPPTAAPPVSEPAGVPAAVPPQEASPPLPVPLQAQPPMEPEALPPAPPEPRSTVAAPVQERPTPEVTAPIAVAPPQTRQASGPAAPCEAAAAQYSGAAFANAVSLYSLEWTPFDRQEWGWETYVPLIQKEIGTTCGANTADFAAALAAWQLRFALPATGIFDQADFGVFRGLWQERRPFVMARVRDECPAPPPLLELGYLVAEEEHADRLTRLLRRDTLAAYRSMIAAARADVPEIEEDRELLQIFSGFRDPEADAARCAAQGNCDGLRRAVCSPHRTGAAVDLYVGQLFGMGVDSTDPASRLHMTRGKTYRWLVDNAGRFGFVPYVYEPWHWEYVGYAVP